MEYIVKKCLKCGKVIRVLKNTNTTTLCCNEEMKVLKPNTEDASYEKHIPCFEIKDNKIIITVNHVMDNDHYIEWISVITNNQEIIKYFKPGDEPILEVDYIKGMTIYSYCNKHNLWMTEVE